MQELRRLSLYSLQTRSRSIGRDVDNACQAHPAVSDGVPRDSSTWLKLVAELNISHSANERIANFAPRVSSATNDLASRSREGNRDKGSAHAAGGITLC